MNTPTPRISLTPGPSPDDDTAVVRRGEMTAPPLLKSLFDFRRGGRGVRHEYTPAR